MELYKGFICHPAVCCVGNNYQIMIPVKYKMLISVQVGNKVYNNHSNGIRISSAEIQRVTVPMAELDRAKKYTVICRKMILRRAYGSITGHEVKIDYNFRPLTKTENIKIYQVADSHSHIMPAVEASKKYGDEIDLLILNGDIAGTSETVKEINVSYKIASGITEGTIPCIMSRGNHDLRGRCAETLANYMPNQNGKSYYTFRVGCIWGILVDSGEDKPDSHEEYGNTVACHQFREEETEFIKAIAQKPDSEFNAPGVKYRLVVSHVPFAFRLEPPFDIEEDIYREWCRILKNNVKPNLMLCGHMHYTAISEIGSKYDTYGQPCTVLIGSIMKKHKKDSKTYYAGMGLELNENKATVTFNTRNEILETKEIDI